MSHIRITFDGAALESHEMDARDLAPALLAMAELLEASVATLYGDSATAQVNVKGSFKTGSFNIDFSTIVDFATTVKDFFSGSTATAAASAITITGLLGFSFKKGFAHVLKWSRGRKITKIEALNNGKVNLFVNDEWIEVEEKVLDLLKSIPVRKAFDKLTAPLDREGIDIFSIGNDAEVFFLAEKQDRASFLLPDSEDAIENRFTMGYSIVSPSFKEDNKWRLSDGNNVISVKVLDNAFLKKIADCEIAFSKGDFLLCHVLARQWQTATGAKTEYEVLEVIQYRSGMRQLPLPSLSEPDKQ